MSTPCVAATGSAGTPRRFAIAIMNATYVVALTAKAAPTLIWAMTIPATAGPRKRALLKMIALIAKAEGSAARLTRVGINARREGCATALKMPSSKVNASNSSIVIVSV